MFHSAKNFPTFSQLCGCILRRNAADMLWRPVLCRSLQPTMTLGPRTAHYRNMSIWYIMKKKVQRAWSDQIKMESFDAINKFGLDIGVTYVLVKMGARVQFTNGKWYSKQDIKRRSLPLEELKGQFVEAIDAMETDLDQFNMAEVVNLSGVKYLRLDGCSLIDDHCLASLVHLRDTLTHLSINRCEQVTENGIATLHKLRNLERLNMSDLPNVKYGPLVAVMLEDVLPRLRISVVSKQVDKYKEEAARGAAIIEEHRRQAGLDESSQHDMGSLNNRIRDGDDRQTFHEQGGQILSKR